MKITTQISLDDVLDNFERSWTIVRMKDGRVLNLYIVDVDDEFQRNDEEDEPELKAIVYNTTDSNSYGNGIAFDDIDSIELDPDKN
ncbi:hypothetical protein NOU10_04775 [Ligilactobacillus sp. MP3]|uniref:hypothetical protein n=1 Tax=Ligilactobacillus sp. MP3 TaxID=2965103 RepID=UPI002108A212|nr:hypothetical protein [Ligilactobacillus sp. MP3]MCQ4116704.1 hypothetical protein [Ligilactobacillus sp. MP3]